MKKLIALLLPFILVLSCEPYEDEDLLSVDQILGKNEYAVHKGILTFKDNESFKKLTDELQSKTIEELDQWEAENNFKSLRSLHEEAIVQEGIFLDEMAAKYPGNTTLTRKDLGYTTFTNRFLKSGLFVTNEFETIDMNVTAPHYGVVVNEDGVFRIGNEIIMPEFNQYKIIKDGDPGKIRLLKGLTESDKEKNIEILAVDRNNFSNDHEGGKAKVTLTSCTDSNDGYRLIVYEDLIQTLTYELPCYNAPASYILTFRSLKKVLGTWQNHKTSQWSVKSTLKIEHWRWCHYVSTTPVSNTFTYYRTVMDITNSTFNIPYGHTYSKYFIQNYDRGPCNSGGFASCAPDNYGYSPDPGGELVFINRQHQVSGKGGTSCYVGQ